MARKTIIIPVNETADQTLPLPSVAEESGQLPEIETGPEEVDESFQGSVPTGDTPQPAEISPVSVPPLDGKREAFARHLLEVETGVDAVYVVDGIFFTDRRRADGRAISKGSHVYTVERI